MKKFKKFFFKPKGTKDIFGIELEKWKYLEKKIKILTKNYAFKEVRTPIFEFSELFIKASNLSDIIFKKEMYLFKDNSGRSLALKPEGTAPIVRFFIENKLYIKNKNNRFYYFSPFFRYERPQKGRFRLFHQFGIEIFDKMNEFLDAEVIEIALNFLKKLKIKNYSLIINTLGEKKCQIFYKKILKNYFKKNLKKLCKNCKLRYLKNPLRILECKIDKNNKIIKKAPINFDFLSDFSKKYFFLFINILKKRKIKFIINPRLVRGLDYYTHIIFEVISKEKNVGAQSTILAGGRYNNLVKKLGGPNINAVGFAAGLERCILYSKFLNCDFVSKYKNNNNNIDVFGIAKNKKCLNYISNCIGILRKFNYSCFFDYENFFSLKSQIKKAYKYNAKIVLICGDSEIKNNKIILKNLFTKKQFIIKKKKMLKFIDKIIKQKNNDKKNTF